ncbi:hypothetical protein LINPERHAP2_LOCUS37210 [Linum perenne]
MVVYYGGTMTETDRGPEYMGGAAVEATIFRDFLSYFQLIKIGTEELRYHAVERMWYVKPGLTPADGLHPIRNDKDAIAMGKAAAGGVVSLYMEVGENDSGFGDNEENIECKWRVYASWWNKDEAYIIKAVGSPQTCGRTQRIKGATAKWIAQRYMGRFRIDPELNTRHLVKEIGLTYGLEVTVRVCANARKEARRILEGTLAEQYAKMRSYVSTLQLADPDGLFALEVDPVPGTQTSKFKRLYVGFSSLRLGFLSGCRRMFALDGCFLKGEVKGMLLSAVGKDGNNQMFPIAWAVVEGENRNSWCWFVHLVKTELLIADGTGWSIISDQQKVKNLVIVELYLCNIPLTIV